MSNTTLISIIQDSGLDDETKQQWTARVEKDGASPALINELRAAIRAHQEQLTQQAAALVSDDPEAKEAVETMNAEIDAAKVDFEAEMKGLQKEADKVAADASKVIEKLTAEEQIDQLKAE